MKRACASRSLATLFRKLDAHAVLEYERLKLISYRLPHDRTGSSRLDVLHEPLVFTPLDLASLMALTLPTVKFIKHLESTQSDIGRNKIDKRVAQCSSALEVAWEVEEIVVSSETIRIK